jgi:transcriptional regulator with XRE-family HTH domain
MRVARESRDMSQVELAKRLGVHASTISCWEAGKRAFPIGRVVDLCKSLKVPASHFFQSTSEEVEELKLGWSTYRGTVLDEVWRAFRDIDGGPMYGAMAVVSNLANKGAE